MKINLIYVLFIVLITTSISISSESGMSVNLSIGSNSFYLVNLSKCKMVDNLPKYGFEGNIISRTVFSINQSVLDLKGYFYSPVKGTKLFVKYGFGVMLEQSNDNQQIEPIHIILSLLRMTCPLWQKYSL